MKLEDFPEHIQKQIKEKLNEPRKAHTQNRSTISPPNMEPSACVRSLEKKANPRLDTQGRMHLHIVSYRHRLADADGISAKALIDGIVLAEILEDDSPNIIQEVSYSQVKIPKVQPAKTIVEVYECLT